MLLLFLLLIPIILYTLYHFFYKSSKPRIIKFVGPRGSGKTRTLYKLIKNKDIETVPSLEDNEMAYENFIIYDVVPKKDECSFNAIYGINDEKTKYFLFFNDENDLVDYERGFNVYFVHCGEWNGRFREGLRNRLIVLKEDPSVLWEYIKSK